MLRQSVDSLKGSISLHATAPFAAGSSRFSGSTFAALSMYTTGTTVSLPARSSSNAAPVPALDIGGIGAVIFPQFAIGGGWASQVVLTNTAAGLATGRIDIFDSNGQPLSVKLNGELKTTFKYAIPAGGTFVLAPRDANGQSPM
jgi:hypothetical protein